MSFCKANPFFTAPLMEGLFFCHCLVLRPEYRGMEAALKHPLVRPRTQGPIHSPSQPKTQERSPGGAGPGHAPARPAGGSSEQPRPPRSHPASPHHGCRALLFRFARLRIRDPRRGPGFMNWSQGPGQGQTLVADQAAKKGGGHLAALSCL